MKHAFIAAVLLTTACGPTITLPSDDTGSAPSTDPGTTLETPPTTVTADSTGANDDTGPNDDDPVPTTPPDPDSTGDMASAGFLEEDDIGNSSFECDIWTQNCPLGEKCMPWANDGGGAWNATRCTPIAEDPGEAGDPCTVEGSGVSGIDSCTLGAMCWDVNPETNEGTCFDLCTGSPAAPVCDDPDTYCAISGDGVIVLCLPNCDPVWQDCPEGQGCYPIGEIFMCAPDAGEPPGVPGAPCEFINVCEPGNFCTNPAVSTVTCLDQGALGCCVPFCHVDMPSCADGEMCVPWFERGGPALPGYDHVGFCTTG